jgi:DNA-binding response OmpR family regulator
LTKQIQPVYDAFNMGIFDRAKSPPPQTPNPSPAKKVLIVEDDAQLSSVLELKFTQAGFAVSKAPNGQVGLDLAISQKPDIIILDLMMPVMDGKTMLRKLRDIPDFKSLPVIVLTNAGSTDNMMETTTLYNASEFLIKSNVSMDDILAKVKQLMTMSI